MPLESSRTSPAGRGRRAGRADRRSREERTEAVQQDLYRAAGMVIGRYGYPAASIARITQQANMAQGTFYNYFSSQDQLFRELLPHVGKKLLATVQEARQTAEGEIGKEKAGLRAFFDFILDVPEFYRILSEAETFAPEAHKVHTGNMVAGYLRALKRARDKGHLGLDDREIEAVAYMLLGIRHYLAMRYAYEDGGAHRVPDWVIECYAGLLANGLFTGSPAAAPPRSDAPRAAEDAAVTVTFVGPDHATGEAFLSKAAGGRSAAAVLSDLAAATALALSGRREDRAFEITSLSLDLLGGPPCGRVTATAVIGAAAEGSLVAQVRIVQASPPAPDLAVAQVGLRAA